VKSGSAQWNGPCRGRAAMQGTGTFAVAPGAAKAKVHVLCCRVLGGIFLARRRYYRFEEDNFS
jgi:hypothetical protein